MEKAVVLLSGGIGSTVAAWVARQECELSLLHADYGQRAAAAEARAFEAIAAACGAARTLKTQLPCFREAGGSARVNPELVLEDAASLSGGPAGTHVPGLMAALLAAGYGWARSIGARRMVVGACENLGPPCPPTSTLHPDCRREFFQIAVHLFNLAAARDSQAVRVETPVIDLELEDIVRLGKHLAAPLHLTWSCLAGGPPPCRRCYGCVTRARAFAAAGLLDPAGQPSAPARVTA